MKVILDDAQSATLTELLHIDLDRPFDVALDEEQTTAVCASCISSDIREQAIRTPGTYFVARSMRPYDRLSYDIHTGRELAMLLRGDKPMAFFAVEQGMKLEDLSEQPFARFVAANDIVENRFSVSLARDRRVQYVVFTLPGEVWRSQALGLIKTISVRWNDTLERLEGLLLGYTEAQCDEHIDLINTKVG